MLRSAGGPSPLVLALAASNALLLTHLLWKPARDLLYRLRMQLLRRLGGPQAEAITDKLLGHDYEPPLPKPIANALERSCLCFLATAGASLEPHLSLMRFTYCQGLDDPNSEVMVISTRKDTRKFEILTENTSVALCVRQPSAAYGQVLA